MFVVTIFLISLSAQHKQGIDDFLILRNFHVVTDPACQSQQLSQARAGFCAWKWGFSMGSPTCLITLDRLNYRSTWRATVSLHN